ncbi:MAG: NAD-dependent protein deacylase [Clostridia bacterium]|nr:NAD-dependent protein deacylase [Clostridia bacterium]
MNTEAELIELLKNANHIVYFGGAGTSTESNIPDFRSQDGLYSLKYRYPPETILSHSFFRTHTEEFYEFYRDKVLYPDAKPNKAHYALAKLEAMGKLKAVVTQNIDGLHQMAGSANVIELHGSVHKNYCQTCGATYGLNYIIASESMVPKCEKCGGLVRPDVVLYEEGLDQNVMEEALKAIAISDVLIVGGTSLVVYPAAGMIRYHQNDRIVLINKSETKYDNQAYLRYNQSIGELLNQVVSAL